MRLIYNILFSVFLCLSAPFYFLKMWRRGNWRPGFSERFGKYDSKVKQALTNRHTLWLHAVSVGEVNICTHLIQALEPRLPNAKLVVSTTTSTGMGELRKRLPSHVQRIYYPIDRRPWVARALGTIHPEAVILVEAEIWPNFLWRCAELGIPVFLINARLSERSYRGYRRWGWLFRPLFANLAGVGCQNEADAERLADLGCRRESIRVLGSLKFDSVKLDERRVLDVPALLDQLGVSKTGLVLVCGSTHAGEEAVLGAIYLRLKKQFPSLFLVIVPRHAERSKTAAQELMDLGLCVVFRTEITERTESNPGSVDCVVVNTTGELRYFYERADVIFVGKSLTAHGGQNPIEPGAMGKAMVFGPNMENFPQIAPAFVSERGALQVKDARELESAFERLLKDDALRADLGANALRVVQKNQGAMQRTVEMILGQLEHSETHIC
ncbi:MAG: 3-deoxy-D-manno-octulosonic acid transferase [Verrucomicrobia bacterium]|nr:3-deoxy-D-manno-octulosonic acid transferase [Verrucomicrobiota bacterium]